jgi:hypothetical protein
MDMEGKLLLLQAELHQYIRVFGPVRSSACVVSEIILLGKT